MVNGATKSELFQEKLTALASEPELEMTSQERSELGAVLESPPMRKALAIVQSQVNNSAAALLGLDLFEESSLNEARRLQFKASGALGAVDLLISLTDWADNEEESSDG